MKKIFGWIYSECPYCFTEHQIPSNAFEIECICGSKWIIGNKWITFEDQFNPIKNSKKRGEK